MTGRRLAGRSVHHVLVRAGQQTMLRVSPHSFRHTHGSMLLDQGWPPTDVAKRLGDDVRTVVKTYAHAMPDAKRDLSFFDELGNGWATYGRSHPSEEEPSPSPEIPDSIGFPENG
jgi:integrase